MHRGEFYRQVLPHNLTPDMIGRSAPVRLLGFIQFEYAGNFISEVTGISETLAVDLPTLSIQWRGRIVSGILEFAYLLQQRVFEQEEGITYRLVITDNLGGILQGEWHWTTANDAWFSGPGGGFDMGDPIGTVHSGLFGPTVGARWFCLQYSDEPP